MAFGVYANLRQKLLHMGYSNVSDDSDLESDPDHQRPRSSSLTIRRVVIVCLVFFLILTTNLLGNFIFQRFYSHRTSLYMSEDGELSHCGSSVQEAHARNCIFDVMANGWTPPQCFSETLSEEFLALPDSKWYYDEEHTKEIPLDVLKLGNIATVFPASTHHNRHCLYTWRRLAEAAHSGGLVDHDSGSTHHTMHCTDYMVGKLTAKPIKSERKFVGCVRLGSAY